MIYESEIEQRIYDNGPSLEAMGFVSLYGNTAKQLTLPCGKRIDMFSWEASGGVLKCKIIEIKKDTLTVKCLSQVIGYLDSLWETIGVSFFKEIHSELIMVGRDIDGSLFNILYHGCSVAAYGVSMEEGGLSFINLIDKNPVIKWDCLAGPLSKAQLNFCNMLIK